MRERNDERAGERKSVATENKMVTARRRESTSAGQWQAITLGGQTYTATMACGSFLRSICGYHVRGIRRKNKREKMARPMSSDDRVSSSHSGGSAPATAGTKRATSTGASGAKENVRAAVLISSRCCCIVTMPSPRCCGARSPSEEGKQEQAGENAIADDSSDSNTNAE